MTTWRQEFRSRFNGPGDSSAVPRLIPPIGCRDPDLPLHTLDALLVRSDDSPRVAAPPGTERGDVACGYRRALNRAPERQILQLRPGTRSERYPEMFMLTLTEITAAIEPSEWARAALATGAPWPTTGRVSDSVMNHAPWQSVAARWVPVRDRARRIDDTNAPRDFSERFARIPTGAERVRIDRFDTQPVPGSRSISLAPTFRRPRKSMVGRCEYRAARVGSYTIDVCGGICAELRRSDGHYTRRPDRTFAGWSDCPSSPQTLVGTRWMRCSPAGTPAGLVESPANVPIVHVVHPEDPVPALGEVIRGTAGTTWVVHTEPAPPEPTHTSSRIIRSPFGG